MSAVSMLQTKEHADLMEMFERTFPGRHDKEPKDSWANGNIYQDGRMNEFFLTFRHGYAYGKALDEVAPGEEESDGE